MKIRITDYFFDAGYISFIRTRALNSLGKYCDEDFIRKVWGKYLREEYKFDKWGGLGKILAIREVMSEEGLDAEVASASALDFERIANELFPRTFSCAQSGNISPALARSLASYYRTVEILLSNSGLTGSILKSTCAEETAEKFCVPVEKVKEIMDEKEGRY